MPDATDTFTSTQPAWIQNEITLGTRLGEACQEGRRADFSYLLSLISSNVTEQGYAQLQRPEKAAREWVPPFPHAQPQPLEARPQDWQRNPSKAIAHSFADWRLLNALDPEALSLQNNPAKIPGVVRDNCPHYVQARLNRSTTQATEQGQEADLVDVIDSLRGVDRSAA
ncbi:VC2046/SO_2500 family protein [Aliidiomarina sp. Khilg15.8]